MRARRTRAETLAALALSLASASSKLLTENFPAAVGSDSDYLDARRALAIGTTDLSRSRNASSGLRIALEPLEPLRAVLRKRNKSLPRSATRFW